jgi:hypothetical protein
LATFNASDALTAVLARWATSVWAARAEKVGYVQQREAQNSENDIGPYLENKNLNNRPNRRIFIATRS